MFIDLMWPCNAMVIPAQAAVHVPAPGFRLGGRNDDGRDTTSSGGIGVRRRGLALWPLLVAAISLFAVAGCGSGPESGGQPVRSPAPTVAVPTATPPPAPTQTPTAVVVVPPEPSPTVAAEGSETGRTRHPAPGFTLPSAKGGSVALADLLEDSRGAVIVFYRGFF